MLAVEPALVRDLPDRETRSESAPDRRVEGIASGAVLGQGRSVLLCRCANSAHLVVTVQLLHVRHLDSGCCNLTLQCCATLSCNAVWHNPEEYSVTDINRTDDAAGEA